jgi:F-type H+-transporting ATPase subunit b
MPAIVPDPVVVIAEIALFVVVWAALAFLWFRPAMRLLHERRARSEGAIREAEAIQAEAEKLRATHAAALDEARAEAQREMHDMLRDAEAEQKRLIAEARAEAQQAIADVRGRIAEEVASARRSLRADADVIAREVARKILGRPV